VTTVTGPPAPSQNAPDRDVPERPYVGLDPFDEKDAAYFFGREHDSDLIVANLTASRLTLLYAQSGVGKSSVLRAGVLPRLHHIDDNSSDTLGVSGAAVVYVRTWRDDPLESIAAAVSAAVSHVTSADSGETDPAETGARERGNSAPKLTVPWLREVLRQSKVSMVYLILDQFEEYFFYHPTDRGEEGLTAELGRILSARELPVHVLLSIREDALAGLDRFEGRVPHLFDNYFRLEHLSRDAAQAAIKGPLDRYNRVVPPDRRMSIEPALVETLLDQVRTGRVRVTPEGTAPEGFASDGPASDDRGDIETPYLQLVLTRLWDSERAAGSSSLRQSTLDELGGAQTIVQTHLDNVMAGLSLAQRDIAAAVFLHLVTTSGTKIALTAEDLANRSGLPVRVSAVRDLLETLSAGPKRILRPVPPPVGVAGPPRYEIFHDVMGPAVLDWRRRYMERRKQAQTARRLLRRALITVAVMLLVVGVLGVFVYINYHDAQRQQQQNLLAQANAALVDSPERSLRHAVKAYQVNADANEQARSAVLTAASSPRSHVVAGPMSLSHPMTVIGMKSTPDARRVVAYDARGRIRVLGGNGAVERQAQASGLRGTVIPGEWVAAVNPDASRVALGTDQGSVAVIDTATGQHLDIQSEGGVLRAVTWIGSAADGLVLVVFKSGVAATYRSDTGQQVARFPGVVDAVALADEQHFVTSGSDKRLAVWDLRTGTKSAESSTLSSAAESLTRYGQSVVGLSEGEKPSIIVWNWQAGPDPLQYPVSDSNQVQKVVVNERAGTIMIAQSGGVRTYSLANGALQELLPAQTDMVTDVALSPDGRWITTANTDGRVLVWFSGYRKPPIASTYRLLAHRGKVTQVSYLREGTVVMSVGIDGTLRRWELPSVPRFEQRGNGVNHMDLSRDGSWLATASQDGHVFILDPQDLAKPPVATVSVGAVVKTVLFDPTDPHRILTLTQRGTAPQRWRWGGDGKSERLASYEAPALPASEYLVSLALSPDGMMVVGGDTLGVVHCWDARTEKRLADRELRGSRPAFDPAGQLLATVDPDGVRLRKLGAAEPPVLLSHPSARSVDFSPSGEYLVSTGRDGTVNIWTRDGTLHHELVLHGRLSSSPSFSGDGGLVAMGTAEGLVEVWDVRSGMTVMLDRHHSSPVSNVIFLPGDRSRLISASDDATLARFSCLACTDPNRVILEAEEWTKTNPE
jgi:WD40 repeat protein